MIFSNCYVENLALRALVKLELRLDGGTGVVAIQPPWLAELDHELTYVQGSLGAEEKPGKMVLLYIVQ